MSNATEFGQVLQKRSDNINTIVINDVERLYTEFLEPVISNAPKIVGIKSNHYWCVAEDIQRAEVTTKAVSQAGRWASVILNDKMHIGMVVASSFLSLNIKMMANHACNKFYWPEKDDICTMELNALLAWTKEPEVEASSSTSQRPMYSLSSSEFDRLTTLFITVMSS